VRVPQRVIIVAGPTASGKSKLAIRLAQEFKGELICSDSMQVYRKLDIGTAKPTLKEQKLVPHHQIDIVDPNENYSAGKYEREASKIIEEIHTRSHIPIIVGGTGLYYRALMYGISKIPDIPENIKKKVATMQLDHGTSYCWKQLQKRDPQGTHNIHRNDTTRILRHLEVLFATGFSITKFHKTQPFAEPRYSFLAVGLDWERNTLYERINQRTLNMLKLGWIAEVETLLKSYSRDLKPLQSIGYREIIEHLSNRLDLEKMIQKIQQRTRQYAKRQITWFQKESKFEWFKPDNEDKVFSKIKVFLEK